MNVAVIFAGGTGQRMKNTSIPKQFMELYGKPVIIYTLEVFQNHPEIDKIIVPCVSGWESHLEDLALKFSITKLDKVLTGGATSQKSKLVALNYLESICVPDDIVMMHDAVRPLVTSKLISDNLACLHKNGTAITVDPFTETGVISIDGETVDSTIERSKLYIAKAPQTFYFSDALWAHEKGEDMPDTIAIDTCTLMTTLGRKLSFVMCESSNIKITTTDDFYIFKTLLDLRQNNENPGEE